MTSATVNNDGPTISGETPLGSPPVYAPPDSTGCDSNATAQTIERLVTRSRQLYSLPAVAAKVLELTENPKVDTRALKECIENDPALSTKVLRVVNSSLFGLRREVSDLNQALGLLGTKPLKLLVLGFSLPAGLFAGVGASTLGWYWRHTLTKAVAAREISETIWHRAGDEAFIAGLLQDLGMLLLIQELGTPYLEFLDKVRQGGLDLFSLEKESVGFDHTALTHALLTHWGLPEALAEAIVWPSSETADAALAGDASDLAVIVYLSEWIARLLADGRADALPQLLSIGWQHRQLTPEQLGTLVENLEDRVKTLADVLSLELPPGTDFRTLLLEAHERLADVAMDVAGELAQSNASRASSPAISDEMRNLSDAAARLVRRPTEPPPTPAKLVPADTSAPAKSDCFQAIGSGRPAPAADDRSLLGQLSLAVTACRQSRSALSLLLVEFGDTDQLILAHGVHEYRELRASVEKACRTLDFPDATCVPHGEAGFAIIVVDCDRQMAVRLGNELIDRVRKTTSGATPGKRSVAGIGVGAATVCVVPKNFPCKDLLVAANRCVYGSRASGGGVVKSIEIY